MDLSSVLGGFLQALRLVGSSLAGVVLTLALVYLICSRRKS